MVKPLDLDVWREACRHIHIQESTSAIAAIATAACPIGQIVVRRIDMGRSCLETVALAPLDPAHPLHGARTECEANQLQRIVAWCRAGEILRRRSEGAADAIASWLIPHGGCGQALAGPLMGPAGPEGVLVLLAAEGKSLGPEAESLLKSLLEPFAVALENDLRIREMAALREAAEADRSSLLSRLGRRSLDDTIVGEDSGLKGVMERVELVARSDVPVLVFGETGTGKELVARAIHSRSSRAAGPFMRVNCGALPPELIDSHLFGHERGSFTGANESRRGWFERADRGTLFLDEIGELPPAAQVRLLRVLQDGAFERVGGQQPITVDVRIVAATHRDLSGMVREGRFREDLWYRLAVFPIDLPPLRARPDDVSALAHHFSQRAAIRFGLAQCRPAAGDVALLTAYSWPGNVRELATVIDRAAILGNGRCLEIAKALGVQAGAPAGAALAAPPASLIVGAAEPPAEKVVSLDEAMRQHIQRALQATYGRIEGPYGAARLLKINPHTLRARMRKLKIDWSQFRSGRSEDPPGD